jgi:tRNA A-37 threonylcarbamoyl transferase component Bud32
MAFVEINARYQSFLEQWGLTNADQFLALPALVVGGHPDRHVTQVVLGKGPGAIRAYMKREHHVSWKERLANAWAGFGLASRSFREYQVLQALRRANIACPDPLASGEDREGRAFLLVREVTGAVDLRVFLGDRIGDKPLERRRFVRLLGETLARIHDAGFDHPDLYSKHLLVNPENGLIRFVDWQRSRRYRYLGWSKRWRDLAALHATLADGLATRQERLACLCAYLRASVQVPVPRSFLLEAIYQIQRLACRLRRRRRIREQLQTPLQIGTQNLIWLKGQALCVTREFREEMREAMPDWLSQPAHGSGKRNEVRRSVVSLPGPRQAHLVRRWANRPLLWLWSVLRRRRFTSPEVEQTGVLFRLQRFGVGTPRLLAVGQRHPLPWRIESFLLTEAPADTMSLAGLLARQAGRPLWTAEHKQRRHWIRTAGQVLRRVHEAGYYGTKWTDRHFVIQAGQPGTTLAAPEVVLGRIDDLRSRKHSLAAWRSRDLHSLQTAFGPLVNSRTDQLRFFLGYLSLECLTPAAKRLIRELHGKKETGAAEHKPLPFRRRLFSQFRRGQKRAAS